jgi:hypothetical protein
VFFFYEAAQPVSIALLQTTWMTLPLHSLYEAPDSMMMLLAFVRRLYTLPDRARTPGGSPPAPVAAMCSGLHPVRIDAATAPVLCC